MLFKAICGHNKVSYRLQLTKTSLKNILVNYNQKTFEITLNYLKRFCKLGKLPIIKYTTTNKTRTTSRVPSTAAWVVFTFNGILLYFVFSILFK